MIEVLVTLVIVAFSLLGFAGLMAKSLKDSRTAYYRSQATFLSYSILESMRVDRANALNASYNIAIGAVKQGEDIAASEINQWKQNLSDSLPGGDGIISVEPDGDVTITIEWDDDGDGVSTIFKSSSAI